MAAVSVIMPAYNVEPYLRPAIESVLAQGFTDWELLVIDDGSTDGSLAIAETFAQRDARIRVLHQSNKGIASARNRALEVASAEVIAVLDADDLWVPDYLGSQMAILAARPDVDIVTANAWFLGGPWTGQPARPTPDPRPAPTLTVMLEDETAVFIMSVFRRRVFDTIGGFDETLRTNEDYDYWLRAAVAGFTFLRNDTPLGYYRRRDDSLSANEVRMLRGILQVLLKLRARLSDRPAERALLDSRILFFDTERLAAEAREAIESRDFRTAYARLRGLHERRGGVALRGATLLAHWAPWLLTVAYRRHVRQLAARTVEANRRAQPNVRAAAPSTS